MLRHALSLALATRIEVEAERLQSDAGQCIDHLQQDTQEGQSCVGSRHETPEDMKPDENERL